MVSEFIGHVREAVDEGTEQVAVKGGFQSSFQSTMSLSFFARILVEHQQSGPRESLGRWRRPAWGGSARTMTVVM